MSKDDKAKEIEDLQSAFVDGAFWMMRKIGTGEGSSETLKAFEKWYRRFLDGTTNNTDPL